jgi:diadenosine tetraphosphate (Ap4A) HIT family hydrolase
MSECPFCDFKDDARGKVTLQNEYCVFIECIDNVLEGWGMIIPKQHRETVFDLTREEWEATYSLLKEVKIHIDERFRPDGYNVGWNVNEVGGQEVLHAHLHIIPRYKDELYSGKGIRYWFKQNENIRQK